MWWHDLHNSNAHLHAYTRNRSCHWMWPRQDVPQDSDTWAPPPPRRASPGSRSSTGRWTLPSLEHSLVRTHLSCRQPLVWQEHHLEISFMSFRLLNVVLPEQTVVLHTNLLSSVQRSSLHWLSWVWTRQPSLSTSFFGSPPAHLLKVHGLQSVQTQVLFPCSLTPPIRLCVFAFYEVVTLHISYWSKMASIPLAELLSIKPALFCPAEVVAAVSMGLPLPAAGANAGGLTVGPIAWCFHCKGIVFINLCLCSVQ